jgi:hypothetical protein
MLPIGRSSGFTRRGAHGLDSSPSGDGVAFDRERLARPGGTSGGIGMFLLGLVMAVGG